MSDPNQNKKEIPIIVIANGCVVDVRNLDEYEVVDLDVEDDGQPDWYQEWHDFDPEC